MKLESTSTRGISLRSKLIPFAPFLDSPPYTPPVPDHPFEPPSDSADDMSGGSRSSTGEGRSMSPDSVVSAAPATSPSPPLTPGSAAKKMFDFKGGLSSSQSRRQWGVTDKVGVSEQQFDYLVLYDYTKTNAFEIKVVFPLWLTNFNVLFFSPWKILCFRPSMLSLLSYD